MMVASLLVALIAVLVSSFPSTEAGYLAGVVQHVAIEGTSPRDTINQNLAAYKLHAEAAGKRGVDILVFPEFGLGGELDSRDGIYPYLEDIPDFVQGQTIIPCLSGNPSTQPISVNASCWARTNNLTIAIEYYDLKVCDRSSDPDCPSDGRYQYNTEVVFGPQGEIIAKYYKYHEWIAFLDAIDTPKEAPLITFTTVFGVKFGIFMCFDMFFPSPALDLVDMGVDHFVYSVAMNMRLGKQAHSTWSSMTKTVLLSSNLGQRWSGIFNDGEEIEPEVIDIPGHSKDSLKIAFVDRA
jgi:pantetheine hydrolase